MTESDFIPSAYRLATNSGSVTWRSPSNIALIKYWGKRSRQIPANPSVSFTLKQCATITKLSYKKLPERSQDFSFDLFFENAPKENFRPKIRTFFKRIDPYFPFLKNYHFKIETVNSFPHSSGIASSASSMSALALCFMSLEKAANPGITDAFFDKKASFIARLGSGSACRSIKGGAVIWGHHSAIKGSSNMYGIPYPHKIHKVFNNYQDTILLVNSSQKQLSSSSGHGLMHRHTFAGKRFAQADQNISRLKDIFYNGNLKGFTQMVESEALTLQAMMMTSLPYFILMKPGTLHIINSIWEFRAKTKLNLCFTLDAGANVHVLYPEHEKEQVLEFINKKLVVYCENERYICDKVGLGAEEL